MSELPPRGLFYFVGQVKRELCENSVIFLNKIPVGNLDCNKYIWRRTDIFKYDF